MIRAIKRCEIEECVEVIRKSFLTVAQEYGFTEENASRFTAFSTTAQRLNWQYDEGRPMYAYFDENGKLAGYYSLHIIIEASIQENAECELNNLCVLPEYRHKHIGEIMFFHALMTAADSGCRKMNIGIVEENKRLRAWYEKLGAIHTGTKKFDFFPFTCGYMEKDISREKDTDCKQNIELWDAYGPDGRLAGCDLIRGEKIPEGLKHIVAEVFVIHKDGDILLMQRDFAKPNYPGFWESGAGGSVLKGECALDGARRELLEETGIAAKDNLENLYHVVKDTTIYRGYLYVTDIPKENIRLQKGETAAFRWVNKQEFREIFYSDQYIDGLRERLREFVEHDFQKEYDCCFTRDQYYFRYRAAAIIIEDGAVLMAGNDIDDYYYSIGGGVHLGETSEQAVIREVFEETGVLYEVDHLAFVNECLFYGEGSLEGKECHGVEFYYLMKPRGTRELCGNNAGVGLMGGKEYTCWLPLAKLDEYKVFPTFFREKFFREKLINPGRKIDHVVSDERTTKK